jgi:hypothetical protein
LALAPPTLLGNGSRHCHGINFTSNRLAEILCRPARVKLVTNSSPKVGRFWVILDSSKIGKARELKGFRFHISKLTR